MKVYTVNLYDNTTDIVRQKFVTVRTEPLRAKKEAYRAIVSALNESGKPFDYNNIILNSVDDVFCPNEDGFVCEFVYDVKYLHGSYVPYRATVYAEEYGD